MGLKIADIVRKDAQDEMWFPWVPEDQTGPRLQFLLRVCPPKAFIKVVNRHTKKIYNRRARAHIETTDSESAAEDVIRNSVQGWKGVTVEALREITLTKPTDASDETAIDFTTENLMALVDAVPEIGAWIVETASNVRNFNQPEADVAEQEKNS